MQILSVHRHRRMSGFLESALLLFQHRLRPKVKLGGHAMLWPSDSLTVRIMMMVEGVGLSLKITLVADWCVELMWKVSRESVS